MRITQRSMAISSLAGLNRNLEATAKLQQQMSSGRTITKPSDSPTGTNSSMLIRSDSARNDQYATNVADGQSWLAEADSKLTSISELTRKVRDLAVAANNTGTSSTATRTANAAQVTELYNTILGVANSQILGRPLFGGTTGNAKAYDTTTGAFIGRPVTAAEPEGNTRRISDAEDVRVDVTGPEAFGDAGKGQPELLAVVKKLSTDMLIDPPVDLAATLSDLTTVLTQLSAAHSTVGARMQRLDNAESLIGDRAVSLKNQLGTIENTDIAKATMELALQDTSYQTALAATAKVIQPTLLDYLR